jgi:hypothetical protein
LNSPLGPTSNTGERKHMKLFGKMVLAGALSLVSLPALAHDHHGRHDRCPPRHGRSAGGWRDGAAAGRRELWVPGHWVRHAGAHVWIDARWSVPPQPAWVWVDPQWVWNGRSWQWQDAHWAPPS